MYVGEGQEQLRALANDLDERVDELAEKARKSEARKTASEYTRGLRDGMRVGLRQAARLARREATRLLRAQRKAFAKNVD